MLKENNFLEVASATVFVFLINLFIIPSTLLADDACPGGRCQTALGEIPTASPDAFIQTVLNIAIAVAGGIAFLLIVFGGLRILVSTGNPEAVAQGREMLTAAIASLLFLIFSVFLLNLIGAEVLHFF